MALCWISYRQAHKGKSTLHKHSTTAKHESLFPFLPSLFSPSHSPPFPLLSLDETQGPATDWDLTCNLYRSSQLVGEKHKGYNKMKGRKDTGISVCWIDLYFHSTILFHLFFLFVRLLNKDEDPLWAASKDVWEDVFLFLRQGSQQDHCGCFGFV